MVCVCVYGERERVCVCMERESVCVCVCVYERESVGVECVYMRERVCVECVSGGRAARKHEPFSCTSGHSPLAAASSWSLR